MILFYPIVLGAALVGFIGPWVALVVLGIPRLVEVLAVFASRSRRPPPHPYAAGRCGSWARHSSTPGAPGRC